MDKTKPEDLKVERVPQNYQYLIIGNGRVATHCAHLFKLLNIPFQQWFRSSNKKLESISKDFSHVLFLIKDSSINSFYQQHSHFFKNKTLLHFSGSLLIDEIIDVHPLMTFTPELYDIETYHSIGFVTSYKNFNKEKHLPGFKNNTYYIPPKHKPLYHATCVLAGNFTNLLWKKLQDNFSDLNLPQELYTPYLKQTLENLMQIKGQDTLTGPLARKDTITINKNISALTNDSYQQVYQAFVNAHLGQQFLEDQ